MSPFDRNSRSTDSNHKPLSKRSRRRKAAAKARANLLHERLEGRAMMAIFTSGGGPVSNYSIIASDRATDVYVRQTALNNLQVANNSSFIGVPSDPNYELASVVPADILYVTNGRSGNGPGPMYRGDNRASPGGPGYQADAVVSASTFFSLSNGNINLPQFDLDVRGFRIPLNPSHPNPFPSEEFQVSRAIQGELFYNNATWQFEVGPTGQMFFREAQRLIGNVQLGSNVVTGLRSTAGLQAGMTVIGRGVPANATVASVLGPNSVRLSAAATQTINSINLDFAPITASLVQPVVGASSISLGEVDRGGRGEGLRGTLTIVWDSPVPTVPDPGATPGLPNPPVVRSFTYTYDNVAVADGGASPWTDFNLVPSATPSPSYDFDLLSAASPGEILGGIIPGTVRGTILFDDDVLSGNAANAANKGLGALSFTTDFTTGGTLYFNRGNQPFGELDWLRVTGSINNGNISLRFTNRYATDSAAAGTVSVNPGTVRIGNISFLRYVQDPNPNSFTVFAGFDLTSQLEVDHLTVGSTANIDSTIIVAEPVSTNRADVVLSTTNVNVRSQVATRDQISITAENVYIDAAMAAPAAFTFQIANDPRNDAAGPVRGRLQLSPSGSLTGAISPTFGQATTPTALVMVHATQADVFAEGIVYGTTQEWLMRSTQNVTNLAPFEFSTRSAATGVDTGLIRGDTVSIVLGNDAPTPLDQSIAYNTLDLNTQVESLRIKAATRQQTVPAPPNPSVSGPFPYNLSIREVDDISFDAVAASGLPISLEAGGNIRFTSALATASDLTIRAAATGGDAARLTMSAPISTTNGQIRLIGDSVAINNAVLVTDAASDSERDDIYITATAGDISLAGLVSAKNRVKLEQRSPLTGVASETPYQSRGVQPILDNGTAIASIVVPDDFVFDNLDVEVDITHPFVGDLTGTLIAPDGRRIRLFSRNGGSGDNFTDTIFDSEAVDANGLPRPISAGVAPFTGRFRPLDSLAPLYGTSALGTWRLEVKDEALGDTGTLDSFTLRFGTTSLVPADRKIFGAGRIVADRLDIDAQGAVGNPSLLPTDTNFFLRTDVNTLAGRTGASMSIDEINDINVVDLRAPGFVSLRANGPDPATGRNAGNAALKATLTDITGLDVASPNGSVDVLFDTAKTIELGNAKGLQQGRFLNSTAAGDVSVRSTAGSIVVLDGPVAAGNARRVRVGTSADLSATSNSQTMSGVVYRLGTPGIVADTLRGRGNLSALLGVSGNALKVGERVLIKNQASTVQNGVYQLTAMSTSAWGGSTVWTLTRAGDSDTAGEMPNNTFVRVNEGNQLGVWQIGANYVVLDGAERAGTIDAGSLNSITYSADTNAGLSVGMVVYGPGIAADTTITELVGGSAGKAVKLSRDAAAPVVAAGEFKFVTPVVARTGTTNGGLDDALVTGLASTADLQPGMLVVGANIPFDTTIESIVNGTSLYLSRPATVSGLDSLKFIRPFITRAGATAGTAITGLSSVAELRPGMVVVGEGVAANTTINLIDPVTRIVTLSQAVTSGLSGVALKFLGTTPTNYGSTPITVTSRSVTTDIGSDDPNDLVTFVVTTTGSTNSAAGSLGKMISLRQENIATTGGAAMQPQKMAFRFSNAIATTQTPIQLTQELPEILSAFTIDGAVRYASPLPVVGQPSQPIIDGSRITMNRQGRAIVDGDVVDGFRFNGAGAAGAGIANVTVGGFNRGAAIEVRNAPGVLVNKATLGINERGDRLANRVGVRFIGGGVTSGGVVDSQVYSSSEAGIVLETASTFATNVKIVGTTIGRPGFENALGVRMSSGQNQLGVDPVGPERALPQVAMTKAAGNTSFTIPSTYTGITAADVGMPLFGAGVSPNVATVPATIASVVVNAARRITTITIIGGTVTGNSLVTFGNVVYTQRPAIDDFGNVISGRDITLPSIVNMANVFLGQTVTGDGLAPNSTITAINGRTVTLSRDMTKTGFAAVTLVAGRRNVIQSNRTGVVLAAGATTVTNTSIINNNFNGLEITGTGSNGAPSGAHHRIGSSMVRSATSNFIHGNGGWGIFLAPPLNDVQKGTQIQIQGNFLGTNASTVVPAATFSNKKGNIGHKPAANEEVYRGPSVGGRLKYAPESNGVDAMQNQHGVYTATGGGGTSGGGGVVPNNPATGRR